MCSHDTIVFGASETSTAHGWEHTKERVVSYLPLSHIAGMMFDIYYPISKAGSTCFADSNALKGTLIDNLKYYKPTRFLGVPRVWEKMEEKIKLAGKETKGRDGNGIFGEKFCSDLLTLQEGASGMDIK